ncbi:MAG: hypothetical protein FD129_1153, partial [bacterium]
MPRLNCIKIAPLAILSGTCLLLLYPVIRPLASSPRAESASDHVSGSPAAWLPLSLKALDPVYDGAGGRSSDADLMAFYADQTEAGLDLRIDLARPGFPDVAREALDRSDAAVYVLIDYVDGGARNLPDGLSPADTDMAWDRAVRFQRGADGRLEGRLLGVDASGKASWLADALDPGEAVAGAAFAARWDMCEAVIDLGAGYRAAVTAALGAPSLAYGLVAPKAAREEATPIRYLVVSAVDGRVEDTIEATNETQSPAGAHNVVFV